MRESVFLCRVHFCVGLGTPFGNEERVVAKAFGARSALGDVPLDDPFEEVLLAVEDQRDDRAEAGPAVADALQVAEQEFVVGGDWLDIKCSEGPAIYYEAGESNYVRIGAKNYYTSDDTAKEFKEYVLSFLENGGYWG